MRSTVPAAARRTPGDPRDEAIQRNLARHALLSARLRVSGSCSSMGNHIMRSLTSPPAMRSACVCNTASVARRAPSRSSPARSATRDRNCAAGTTLISGPRLSRSPRASVQPGCPTHGEHPSDLTCLLAGHMLGEGLQRRADRPLAPGSVGLRQPCHGGDECFVVHDGTRVASTPIRPAMTNFRLADRLGTHRWHPVAPGGTR